MRFLIFLRPLNLLLIALLQTVLVVKFAAITCSCETKAYIFMGISTLITAIGGYWINDLFDKKSDSINLKKQNLFSKELLSINTGYVVYILLFVVSIWLSWFVNDSFFVLNIGNSVFLFLYSYYFKKTPFAGIIITSLLVASLPYSVFLSGADIPKNFLLNISLLIFTGNIIRELIKTVEDQEGDRLSGYKTLPIQYSSDWVTMALLVLIGLCAYAGFVFFGNLSELMEHYSSPWRSYVGLLIRLLFVAGLFYLAFVSHKQLYKENVARKLSAVIKVIMLIVVLSLWLI